ncbi:MAG: EF-P lysine aminoacylase EpmA [Pseudohaliea sp.]
MDDWRPAASPAALARRAELLAAVRDFFSRRGVLEVETPLLARHGVTDPAIEPLVVQGGASLSAPRYLQSSPEYAMKRLLAAGSGPIYQLGKAFRDGEAGRRHNPEFTLLEWYRPGFDHHALMGEVAELLEHCLGPTGWRKVTYGDLFQAHLGLDPHSADTETLAAAARAELAAGDLELDRDGWLDLLLSHRIEPALEGVVCIHAYPVSQAALARIDESGPVPVAERFEFYVDGLELANGYHELADPAEQARRFAADNARRRQLGLAERAPDARLLAALEAGLPACSGVALGFDRLLMVATGAGSLDEVLAFPWGQS